jgi:multidrug resistance efflux pump
MLEVLVCSLVTILPDYLYRRYAQGKRLGKEITFYSVWFELRWGITTCLILTVTLIMVIFYNHPSTTNATLFFRTVPILPETNGRVAEIYVGMGGPIAQGAPIFRLDNSRQQAAVETARRKIAETEAAMIVAEADIQKAEGQVREAQGAQQQALDELETKQELHKRNPGIVPLRDLERLQVRVDATQGTVAAAIASRRAAEIRATSVLPAEKASAEAQLAEAHVELAKTVVRAGVSGRVEQFVLRVGDVVNPLMRPAGILIPEGAGQRGLQAGFDQIEAQIIKPGMIAEATCVSKPWTIIPMVVTQVQDFIAAGQFRGGEQLLDPQQVRQPGTLFVYLEPLYEGGLQGVTPGSTCIANAYSNNHDIIAAKDTSFLRGVALHAVDALGLRACADPTASGAGASVQDAGVQRALTRARLNEGRVKDDPMTWPGAAHRSWPMVRRVRRQLRFSC